MSRLVQIMVRKIGLGLEHLYERRSGGPTRIRVRVRVCSEKSQVRAQEGVRVGLGEGYGGFT